MPEADAGKLPPPPPPEAQRLSVFSRLLESLSSLLSGKLRLAQMEMARDLAELRVAAILLAGLAVALLLALIFTGAGAALFLGRLLDSPAAGFLLVAGFCLVAGLLLLGAGWRRLRRLRDFLAETRADLKRDAEWLERLR
ncbi:MAG TPA: phage holin family protein [Candidatus Polarisedimenticolia bacterium]|nr:phage holin family protein [Candidatus Polarisedimenticolia bacterium]